MEIRKQYKNNNKPKIIALVWNDESVFLDDSYCVSDIQDYIEYFIEKLETLTTIPPIHVYINRINNRLVFNIKDGYDLAVVEIVLVHCNLVDNQCQQNSELL